MSSLVVIRYEEPERTILELIPQFESSLLGGTRIWVFFVSPCALRDSMHDLGTVLWV